MAITVTTLRPAPPLAAAQIAGATPWQVSGTSADASSCEELKAAPGAGYCLVLTKLVIHIGASISVTVGAGESSNAVWGDAIGPLGGAAGTYTLDFGDRPVALAANKSLTVDASGAGTVCVYAAGYTKVHSPTGIGSSSVSSSPSASISASISASVSSSISASISSSPSASVSASPSSSAS